VTVIIDRFSNFFGKNKVMQYALGKSEEDEMKPKIHLLSENITGNCGLLMTNESEASVIKYFETYKQLDFAKTGYIATETIQLRAGPLIQFNHSMEPYLRNSLHLPTALKNGVIELIKDHSICTIGQEISSDQARTLQLLGIKMAEMTFEIVCAWSDGKFKLFSKD